MKTLKEFKNRLSHHSIRELSKISGVSERTVTALKDGRYIDPNIEIITKLDAAMSVIREEKGND